MLSKKITFISKLHWISEVKKYNGCMKVGSNHFAEMVLNNKSAPLREHNSYVRTIYSGKIIFCTFWLGLFRAILSKERITKLLEECSFLKTNRSYLSIKSVLSMFVWLFWFIFSFKFLFTCNHCNRSFRSIYPLSLSICCLRITIN